MLYEVITSHNYYDYNKNYLITKANLFYYDQKYDSAMVTILKARDVANNTNSQGDIEILHLLGDIFFALEFYSGAEEYYKKANALVINPTKHNDWRPRVIRNNFV